MDKKQFSMTNVRLKTLREERNLTQEYMAAELGISQNNYSQIETGKAAIKVQMLLEIARILDVDPSTLLTPDTITVNIFDNKIDTGAVFYTGEQNLHMYDKEILAMLRKQLDEKDSLIEKLTSLLKQK
jgi:transcriptional regulator with XRE-family HTH domain